MAFHCYIDVYREGIDIGESLLDPHPVALGSILSVHEFFLLEIIVTERSDVFDGVWTKKGG